MLGSLEEFICNNNFANISDDNRELIDKYNEIGIICAEEKEYIDKLAKELDLSVSQIMRRALKLYKEKLADSKVTLD